MYNFHILRLINLALGRIFWLKVFGLRRLIQNEILELVFWLNLCVLNIFSHLLFMWLILNVLTTMNKHIIICIILFNFIDLGSLMLDYWLLSVNAVFSGQISVFMIRFQKWRLSFLLSYDLSTKLTSWQLLLNTFLEASGCILLMHCLLMV